ncbi:oxygen-insensitive NADPH nitroreductase [Peribacillus saganii]|uniref:Oxygen-insensitive NADPH nitroreductase n=1 Tax=Peribacillus saganii TaxID=2303992 RepID=A0A372LTK8_9BACI|nr:oxygen-insensitive NADPH nitroreductase [Peribacillus saganii]RFU71227.1 oxygen-insensitive NADPH nitroreductase [Peribacillus saganii]
MNEVIETILNHRSIRSFKEQNLTAEQIETIVRSAQSASTSSFVQAYTIIGVNDREKKQRLAELAGEQSYVENNGHFFVFCGDLNRHRILAEMEDVNLQAPLESTEKFMVACIDAALAAQNAALAAESMGLGICYIGGIRNDLPVVCDLLSIPEGVLPLFGMAVGYPKKVTDKKPRLPLENIYHENGYNNDEASFKDQLIKYNETISAYYEERTDGARKDTWTGQMVHMIGAKSRMYMKEFVEQRNLNKR